MLAEARSYIQIRAPYLAATIYAFKIVWAGGMKTLGITKSLVCYLDPQWFAELPSVKMRASCLVHECMHILRDIRRMEVLENKELANIAGDIPINDDMLTAKVGAENMWELPDWAVTSAKFKFPPGLPLEAYYALLKELKKEGSGNDGNPFVVGGQQIANKIFAGGCGSGGGHAPSKQLEDQLDAEHGRSEPEVQQIIKDGIKNIQEYAKTKGRGRLPSGLEELLEWEDIQPVVPWREVLRHVVRRAVGRVIAGRSDFSMRRPAKRSYALGILRPGLVTREVTVAFARDTSGSMGVEQLQTATTESCSVMEQLGVQRAWYLDADASVASAQLVNIREIKEMPVLGRGGTDFRPAIEFAKTLKPRPSVLIYLTDGDGYAPLEAPTEFQVVWCIVPCGWQRLPAKWGIPVIMSDDGTIRDAYEYPDEEDEDE